MVDYLDFNYSKKSSLEPRRNCVAQRLITRAQVRKLEVEHGGLIIRSGKAFGEDWSFKNDENESFFILFHIRCMSCYLHENLYI